MKVQAFIKPDSIREHDASRANRFENQTLYQRFWTPEQLER